MIHYEEFKINVFSEYQINWSFFCLATTLLLLKPLSVNAQSLEQSDVRDRNRLESLNVRSDAKELAQFNREEIEVEVEEPVDTETNEPRSYN